MRRFATGAGFLMALALALAGCGGDPEADPPPTPSTPATSPVSTTPSVPALPDAAKENTKAGAIAFVKYYVELINHAQASGDVAALEAVEDPGCKSCANGRKYIEEIYGAGGHVTGGRWSLRNINARRSGENWAVTATGRFAPSDAYPSAGADPKHADGGPALTNFIVWREESWKVRTWFSG